MKPFLIYLSVIISISLLLPLCKKSDSLKKISAQELYETEGILLPDLKYKGVPDEEVPTSKPDSKGNVKAKKNAEAVLLTVSHDQTIDITGTTITGSVSPEAYYASAQKFIDTTTNDGAVGLWECNRWYSQPAGAGATTTCQTIGSGFYRVFSAEFVTYNVKLSWFKQYTE